MPPLTLLPVVPAKVPGNREQPTAEGRRIAQGGQPLDGPQQRVLGHVLGAIRIRQEPQAYREDRSGVVLDQFGRGVAIAGYRSGDEFCIRSHKWAPISHVDPFRLCIVDEWGWRGIAGIWPV